MLRPPCYSGLLSSVARMNHGCTTIFVCSPAAESMLGHSSLVVGRSETPSCWTTSPSSSWILHGAVACLCLNFRRSSCRAQQHTHTCTVLVLQEVMFFSFREEQNCLSKVAAPKGSGRVHTRTVPYVSYGTAHNIFSKIRRCDLAFHNHHLATTDIIVVVVSCSSLSITLNINSYNYYYPYYYY